MFLTTLEKNVIKNMDLMVNPVYYISASQFVDAASLKYTRQELELLLDREMYETYEAGIRGGISIITHRYALANIVTFMIIKLEKLLNYLKNKQ